MSGLSDNEDFGDENASPNTNHLSQPNASSTVILLKKLVLPAEFFTCVGEVPGKNASLYRCLYPDCVPKKKRDGSEKPLVVPHSSRYNAKSLNNTPISVNRRAIITQEDLDSWVLNFLVVDALPISTVEKPGFKQLVNCLAPNLKMIEYLHKEYQVVDKLRGATTDNGSNFLKLFRKSGNASNVPNYDDDDFEQSDEEDALYFEIGEIIDGRITQDYFANNVNPTLPMHRKCACHLLSLIAKADISKIQDHTFQELKNSLQDNASIIKCQSLITGLLDAIYEKFEHMFSDNELRLATITNPFFKLSWLDNEDDVRRAKTFSDDSNDGTSSSVSDPSTEKKQRRAKDFFASITKRNEKSKVIDEVETFLKMCGNLDDLPNYPTIMKMYK
ncbi:uncharacterized protein LOC116932957 [Daphnia magna]|uniref:uncharacterized protein LOC116932957 n=1 Tax=Daphnia magna TaxID=35525 RepID=UPI001E1BC8E3|nr:uncharacterized protein LOC116932957 [Daphnia magna]